MTIDRAIHLAVGFVLLALILFKRKGLLEADDYCILLIACGIATWVPDWDLILGIGFHRSPLTHSILPWVLVYLGFRKLKFSNKASIGFAIGLASHLLWDIIFYGDVRWIQGGNYDRLFLFTNTLILLGLSQFQIIKTYNKSKHISKHIDSDNAASV